MHFVKQEGVLKIYVEMAFEEHLCSPFSHSRRYSHQAPSCHCCYLASLGSCVCDSSVFRSLSLWNGSRLKLSRPRSPQGWPLVQVQMQAGGCLFISQHCRVSEVYFSPLKSHRPLSERSQELLQIVLFGECLRLFTQETNLSSLSPACLGLFLYVIISSVYFLTETI